MNKVILIGRLTREPEIRNTETIKIARYTVAVDRRTKDKEADFIPCVAFGKSADFAEKYFSKGTKIAVEGHIQTGSYEKEGRKIYTTDVIVESQEFAGAKATQTSNENEFGAVDDQVPEFPF